MGRYLAHDDVRRPAPISIYRARTLRLSIKAADSRLFYSRSLPLGGAGGFGGDVIDDPVDAAHLVDVAGRGAAEDLVGEGVLGRGHAVGPAHRLQGADEVVRTCIAHDTTH